MMNMERPRTILNDMSVKSILLKNGSMEAVGRVRSIELPTIDLTLVGFIIDGEFSPEVMERSNKGLFIDLNSRLIVHSYFIRFATQQINIDHLNRVHPIFQEVALAKGKKYDLIDNIFFNALLASDLTKENVKALNINNTDIWAYNVYLKGTHIHRQLCNRDRWDKDKRIKDNEDGSYYYEGQENDIALSSNVLNQTAIATDFLCLCRYINPVTGLPSYTLLKSDDAIMVKDDD